VIDNRSVIGSSPTSGVDYAPHVMVGGTVPLEHFITNEVLYPCTGVLHPKTPAVISCGSWNEILADRPEHSKL
jgi:hypothetical protein